MPTPNTSFPDFGNGCLRYFNEDGRPKIGLCPTDVRRDAMNRDEPFSIRQGALRWLGVSDIEKTPYCETLVDFLEDEDPEIVSRAFMGLGAIARGRHVAEFLSLGKNFESRVLAAARKGTGRHGNLAGLLYRVAVNDDVESEMNRLRATGLFSDGAKISPRNLAELEQAIESRDE